MTKIRFLMLGLHIGVLGIHFAPAQEKGSEITDKDFARIALLFLEDPVGPKAKDYAKILVVYTIETPKAAVFLGKDEIAWFGKDDERSLLLYAAYSAGNTQAQLHTGIKRNDRYSGLLYLFRVYRSLQERDKNFKNPEVEKLMKLHREDQLFKFLLDLEAKSPTKLTPEQEEALKKLREKKK